MKLGVCLVDPLGLSFSVYFTGCSADRQVLDVAIWRTYFFENSSFPLKSSATALKSQSLPLRTQPVLSNDFIYSIPFRFCSFYSLKRDRIFPQPVRGENILRFSLRQPTAQTKRILNGFVNPGMGWNPFQHTSGDVPGRPCSDNRSMPGRPHRYPLRSTTASCCSRSFWP